MAKDIDTKYVDTKVTCSCGNAFTVKSTQDELHVEACDKCHPFYTGAQDGAGSKTGRAEKFNQKYGFTKEEK